MGRRVRGDDHRKEIVMPSSRMRHRISHLGFAAASTLALLATSAAFASQGPGGGPGPAGSFTQLALAILAYGTSALVGRARLFGAERRRGPLPGPQQQLMRGRVQAPLARVSLTTDPCES